MQRVDHALCLSAALLLSAAFFIASGIPHPLRFERETVVSLAGATASRAVTAYAAVSRTERASTLRLYPLAPVSMNDLGRDTALIARTPKALILPRT